MVAELDRLRAVNAELVGLLEFAADELDRVAHHDPDTPGLIYDSLEALVRSATGCADLAADKLRAAIAKAKETAK